MIKRDMVQTGFLERKTIENGAISWEKLEKKDSSGS